MNRLCTLAVALTLSVVVLAACKKSPDEQTLMHAGLDALYTQHNPNAAVADFRKVLELNPTHYGATYQLATALDAAGQKDEAGTVWEKVLSLAEAINDKGTIDTARARLGKPTPQEESMRAGLDALYKQRDPNAAIPNFRKVLELNPNHYGATYQLATALDAAGARDEARPLWEKMLKMAEGANDKPTADTARARLAPTP